MQCQIVLVKLPALLIVVLSSLPPVQSVWLKFYHIFYVSFKIPYLFPTAKIDVFLELFWNLFYFWKIKMELKYMSTFINLCEIHIIVSIKGHMNFIQNKAFIVNRKLTKINSVAYSQRIWLLYSWSLTLEDFAMFTTLDTWGAKPV